jgi:hypothetical protein
MTSDVSASSATDYIALSGTLNFAAGESTKNLTVTVRTDNVGEADETFSVTLKNPSNANLGNPATALVTIMDKKQPRGRGKLSPSRAQTRLMHHRIGE